MDQTGAIPVLTPMSLVHNYGTTCRSASVRAANSKGVPLDKILSAGGWSHPSTFSKYYNTLIVDIYGMV